MTTYRAGQRVRIEWPNGSAVEGVLIGAAGMLVAYAVRHYMDVVAAESEGATVTILAEPRPDEPTGLGAVVEADWRLNSPSNPVGPWVRLPAPDDDRWWHDGRYRAAWGELVDPVVLSEGWTP